MHAPPYRIHLFGPNIPRQGYVRTNRQPYKDGNQQIDQRCIGTYSRHGGAVLSAQGDTRRPLYALFLAGVANVAMNLLFVIGMGLGVAGVGFATAISQYISAGLVLWFLAQEQDAIRLDFRQLRMDPEIVRRIFRDRTETGFQASDCVGKWYKPTQASAGTNRPASQAWAHIEGFVFAMINTFYQAAMTFTSQNYGAGKYKRVDKVTVYCQIFTVATGLILGNLTNHRVHNTAQGV